MEDEEMEAVQQLELLANELYDAKPKHLHSEAETLLIDLIYTKNCCNKCFLLLERRKSTYSQLLAAKTLLKLVSAINSPISKNQKRTIQLYILNYIVNNNDLEIYVLQSLVQVYCQIVKLSWFDLIEDNYIFRNVLGDVSNYIKSDNSHYMFIGVYILSSLINEMNDIKEGHKKISYSFRDTHLFDYFQMGCSFLQNVSLVIDKINFNDQIQINILNHSLQLVCNCLSYDFIGTSLDESSEDMCTIQIPTHWKIAFVDGSLLQVFFNLLNYIPTMLTTSVLKCLVQMASLRRSLFNANERFQYLKELCQGLNQCITLAHKLADRDVYHEVCRFLARLKTNFQLTELLRLKDYSEFVKLLAQFTISCLQMLDFPSNSSYYLLSFWQKMVAPVPYVRTSEPHMLELYTPEIFKVFVISKLESVTYNTRHNLDDPLEEQTFLFQQLEQIAAIGRYEYKQACSLLIQLFDDASQQLCNTFNNINNQQMIHFAIQEGCLTWLVLLIGAFVGGKISFMSTEEHDTIDGELVCRVLKFMKESDCRSCDHKFERLEKAYINFLDQFRKIYIGDQVQKSSKVYRCLSEVLGINDETTMLNVIIHKIMTNLKHWGLSEPIIELTLQLFNDLSVGFSCVRKIVKLEEIQFILYNHSVDQFEFLSSNIDVMKCRTMFYTSLSRLLVLDLTEENDMFWRFIAPIQASFDYMRNLLPQKFVTTNEIQRYVIGLCHDIKGIAFAFNTKTSYMMLFDWFFPDNSLLLIKMLDMFHYNPQVTTPLLKLYHELAYNRSQRLLFDISSPNGIILFREISKVLVTYGIHILNSPDVPVDKLYATKLKGIMICFRMLKSALSGNYVNFGVFQLYEDPTLNNALQMFIKLLSSIDLKTIMEYPKLTQSYFLLLETVSQDHLNFVCSLDTDVLTYIFSTLSNALLTTEPPVLTSCCATLDNITTYLYKTVSKKVKPSDDVHGLLNVNPLILKQVLSNIFHMVIFEECRNQWSLSRPMFGLILLNEEHFNSLKIDLVKNHPVSRQPIILECFNKLMDGVEKNLAIKHRDKFTHNLSVFRHDLTDVMKLNETQMNTDMF